MYPRSAAFDAAVAAGGIVRSSVDVCRGGVTILADIPWSRPSTVTVDETASAWRSCSITVTDIDRNLLPRNPTDALAPFGTDLFIKVGFQFPSGIVEQVPVGLFRIVTSRPTTRGQVLLIGYDYSRVVAVARFERPKVFARGSSRPGAIATLIAERVPFALVSFADDGSTTPLTIFEEGERYGSPWKACSELAEAGAERVRFGPNGPVPTAVLSPVVASAETPLWTFGDGYQFPSSTKVDVVPELDSSEARNVYVVTGESAELASSGPVRASAEITDPASPIYPGTFGRAPTFLASTFLKTTAQCQAVADANLPLKAGASENLTIVGFGHPAFEAGDTVYAKDDATGVDGNKVISRFQLDISLQQKVSYVCRERRIA